MQGLKSQFVLFYCFISYFYLSFYLLFFKCHITFTFLLLHNTILMSFAGVHHSSKSYLKEKLSYIKDLDAKFLSDII